MSTRNDKDSQYTDYKRVSDLAESLGFSVTAIRDFIKAVGLKPRYLMSIAMYSETELQLALRPKPIRKSKEKP